MEIIPAIDIIDGKCVRLTQGDYSQKKIYNNNPLDVALEFEDIGIKRLHLVDLDGAEKGRIINYAVLEKIAKKTKLIIDYGGGIKSDEDIRIIFECGAKMASIGSLAVKNKVLFHSWIKQYGSNSILLGADVKDEKIAIGGWLESTDIAIIDFIDEHSKAGISSVFCTDISKDGMLEGPSIDLYRKIMEKFPMLKLIASGGVSSMADLEKLDQIGCSGVIVGKAIYENRIKLTDLKTFLS